MTFFVVGLPRPQGSKRPIVIAGKAHLIEMSKGLKSWRNDVAAAALAVRPRDWTLTQKHAVEIVLVFAFQRPLSHLLKNGTLTKAAPLRPLGPPDTDKLIRAVGDALTGVLWRDDSELVSVHAEKVYTRAEPGCFASIRRSYGGWSSQAMQDVVGPHGFVVGGSDLWHRTAVMSFAEAPR